jgi:alpha-mannosidase
MTRVKLFPEKFSTGKYSGSPRDFEWYETLKTLPRGGPDQLDIWYSDDPEENEYMSKGFQDFIDTRLTALKQQGWDPAKQFAYCISQSHLDLGWMWHFRQGVAKAETTFNKAHEHFKWFPPLTFTGSQVGQYQWIKTHDPVIWSNVVDDVARRRHEPQGGTWCEADGRMPSGEAWVRHCLYGQLFYARNFGKLATISWFPDSFGFANNLPQIFAKSGMTGFFTTKLISNKETKWPFWAWQWEAPDGSRLLSYLTGIEGKLGPMMSFDKPQGDSPVRESYVNSYKLLAKGQQLVADYEMDQPELRPEMSNDDLPLLGVFFGEGDGGHGPQGVEVATCRGMVERGVATWCNAKEFFEMLAAWADRFPVWKDELYYEFHRGSLTTQTLIKRMNRYFEWSLPAAEALCTIATRAVPGSRVESLAHFYTGEQDQTPVASNAIEQIWENVLIMQFHDVFPGTSIPEVYDECYEFWTQDKPLLETITREALAIIAKAQGLENPRPVEINLPEPLNIDVPGQESLTLDKFVMFPVMVGNATGGTVNSVANMPSHLINGMIPFAVISDVAAGNIGPVQLVKADETGQDIDLQPDRWLFRAWVPAWTTLTCWVLAIPSSSTNLDDTANANSIASSVFAMLGKTLDASGNQCSVVDELDTLGLSCAAQSFAIDKASGALVHLDHDGVSYVKGSCGLQLYGDTPFREPCWNIQAGYWDYPVPDSHAATVELRENGPVQWTIRVVKPVGDNSRSVIDYTLVPGMDGIGVSIGLDFHETETLVKYEIAHVIDGEHSIAETCYATSKRRNKPVANHDVPRWEKWMHTFVTVENANVGLAVVNEGKYGFDTRDGKLGISIIHGPKYPETNIVAWARDERRTRLKNGLGEPPSHADQGPHLARLWLLPYRGTWKKGMVHQAAHGFNTRFQVLPFVNTMDETSMVVAGNEFSIEATRAAIHDAQPGAIEWKRWAIVEPASVEVTVMKPAEKLPPIIDLARGQVIGVVIRVINNIDEDNHGKVILDTALVPAEASVMETDLLERPIRNVLDPRYSSARLPEGPIVLEMDFKPHEIRTFKLYL